MGVKVVTTGAPRSTTSGLARRGELAALIALVVGILALTDLPYAFAYGSAPPDRQFMGIVLNVPDTTQYLSWARELGHAVLIDNKLTPERGAPAYFNLFWFVVGRVSVAIGLGLPEMMRWIRPFAGAAYLGACYWFVDLVTKRSDGVPLRGGAGVARWTSFLVIALGGGLGWLLVVAKQLTGELAAPLDLYVTEANTFLTVLAFPHQAAATGLLVLLLGLVALAFERNSLRLAALAGLLGLALGLQHGYDLIVVYAVVGATALLLGRRGGDWPRLALLSVVACGPSAPAAAYLLLLIRQSPIWRGVLAQYGNAGVYTPGPLHLLVLMGLPLVVLVSVRAAPAPLARLAPREILLRCWLVVGFLLLYLPTDFQVKMLAGWQVPVGILATRTLLESVGPAARAKLEPVGLLSPKRALRLAGALIVVVVLPVNVYLFAWRFVDLQRHAAPYYLPRDEVAALHWLESHAQPSDVVLSSLTIGQYVPSVAGTKAFLAHWAETLDYYTKQRLVDQFFAGATTDDARREILARYDVRYVFVGEHERALGSYDPGRSSWLRPVFVGSGVTVYEVVSASDAGAVRSEIGGERGE